MLFRQLFDRESCTYTYLLACEETGEAVLIDPVRSLYDRDAQLLDELGLTLKYTLETHVHADHVTSSGLFRARRGSQSVVSEAGGAACADLRPSDGDLIRFGTHELEVRATPGHTDGCVAYVDHGNTRVFTGDTLMIRGCGRTDFQQGSASNLYDSVHQKIFSLGEAFTIYPGHDYKGRTSTTVAEEQAHNPRLGGGRTKAEFIEIMDNLKLANPKMIHIAVPANLQCGIVAESGEVLPEPQAWAPVTRTSEGVPEVDVAWLSGNLRAARLVDVRREAELVGELGAIRGVDHVVLDALEGEAASWDRAAPVVVICRSGGRSGRAAALLEGMGFDKVASFKGGMLAWNHAGLPVVKGAVEAGEPAAPASCG
jgi:glyoxylase-like metal-dependent hydrolase (beta-lactamase superfamily II)/rhodanese-related sulfurtransferase